MIKTITQLQGSVKLELQNYNLKMSSNKFLQRFQGKIQTVGKEGVHNVFGGKQDNVLVYTNNNFNPNKNKPSQSLTKSKPTPEIPKDLKLSQKKIQQVPEISHSKEPQQKANQPTATKEKKTQNPFLISNPFYLDQEERQRAEQERKESQKLQKEREKEAQRLAMQNKKIPPLANKSVDKKKTQKDWVKLGGLGANIGGDQWVQKKKKLDKMQEFSEQVKSINKDKPKVPKPNDRLEKKDPNPRQKALQYSKNVPKPVVRVLQSEREEPEEKEAVAEEQLSELQQYELRHQQLKNMLKNQL